MKKLLGAVLGIALGLSLTLVGAQPAAACNGDQIAKASVESDAADVNLYAEVTVNEEGYPASVGAGQFTTLTWCSDGTVQAVEDGAEDPEGFVEALIDFLGHLLP